MREMTDKQIGYVAGVIDGEANISIRRIASGKSFYCYMNVSNTSHDLLVFLKEVTDIGYINGPFKNKGDNRRPYWKWHVTQAELLELLPIVRNLLIVKKQICSLVFAMRELQSSDWRTTQPDILAARERVFGEAKSVNKRGLRETGGELLGSPDRVISSQGETGMSRKVQRLGAEARTASNAPTSALPERDDIVRTA